MNRHHYESSSESSSLKTKIFPWIKLALGVLVVVYVLKSRLIDFESLKEVLFSPETALMSFGFLTITTLLCCFRWFLLTRAQGINASFGGMLELMMIGTFFNLFMPGSVGGDLVKGWYIAKEQPTKRTRAVFTVIFDRAIGLSIFFFASAVTLFIFSDWMDGKPALQAIAAPIWGISGAMLLGGVFFFSPLWNTKPIQSVVAFFRKNSFAGKIIDAADAYRDQIPTVLLALFVSAISVTLNILFYFWLGTKLGIVATVAQFFFLVPVGLTVSAVPILPGGIGVAQVAFFKLFSWIGISNPEAGATLCTATQIYNILFGCLGAIFYFKYRKKLPTTVESTDALVKSDSSVA